MATKLTKDPGRLVEELATANARVRELTKSVAGVAQERKDLHRALDAAAAADATSEQAQAEAKRLARKVEALEAEVSSLQAVIASNQKLVDGCRAIKQGFQAL